MSVNTSHEAGQKQKTAKSVITGLKDRIYEHECVSTLH